MSGVKHLSLPCVCVSLGWSWQKLGISSRLHVELAFLAPFSTGIMVAGHQPVPLCVCVCVESDFLVS